MCLIETFHTLIESLTTLYQDTEIISNLQLIVLRKQQAFYQEELYIANTKSLATRKSSFTRKVYTFILDVNCCNVPFS